MDFDLANVTVTEFGVGLDDTDGQHFLTVPVAAEVQTALGEMAQETWRALQDRQGDPARYEPSEKYGSTEHLYLPLDDVLATPVRDIHEATNLRIDARALAEPAAVFCYFGRLTDNRGRRLTALRRSTQFKGIVKRRNRLVRVVDDTLTIIPDTVFKLDNDFDLLVDGTRVHILRPGGFEFAARLQQAVLDAVPGNIERIRAGLPFVEFANVGAYARAHPRAARYVASIRQQRTEIDRALLVTACEQTGVDVIESNGTVSVATGHEMRFLEVLDRRLYAVDFVTGNPERYRASSRRQIDG